MKKNKKQKPFLINLHKDIAEKLKDMKVYERESYTDVIRRLIKECESIKNEK